MCTAVTETMRAFDCAVSDRRALEAEEGVANGHPSGTVMAAFDTQGRAVRQRSDSGSGNDSSDHGPSALKGPARSTGAVVQLQPTPSDAGVEEDVNVHSGYVPTRHLLRFYCTTFLPTENSHGHPFRANTHTHPSERVTALRSCRDDDYEASAVPDGVPAGGNGVGSPQGAPPQL